MDNKKDNEFVNIKQEEKITKRIGINTFGILLILFGLLIVLQLFIKFEYLRYILMLWPAILVCLGVETLYYNNNPKVNIKFDFGAFICMIFILGFSFVIAIANIGVNKIMYSEDATKYFQNYIDDANDTYLYDGKVSIENLTDKKINTEVVENSNTEYTKAIINVKYKENYADNLFSAIFVLSDDEIFNAYGDSLTIVSFPDYIESIKVTVVTNNKENVKLIGNE